MRGKKMIAMPKSTGRGKPKDDNDSDRKARVRPAPLPEPPAVAASSTQYLASDRMFAAIKGMGRNWDSECESLLAPPEGLYRSDSANSSYYSGDNEFSIIEVERSLASSGNAVLPEQTYGLAIVEKARSVYVTFADSSRRIIVRMKMVSYGDEPANRDWANFKSAIRSALGRAGSEEAKKGGMVAVFNGLLSLVQPAESPLLRSPPITGPVIGHR